MQSCGQVSSGMGLRFQGGVVSVLSRLERGPWGNREPIPFEVGSQIFSEKLFTLQNLEKVRDPKRVVNAGRWGTHPEQYSAPLAVQKVADCLSLCCILVSAQSDYRLMQFGISATQEFISSDSSRRWFRSKGNAKSTVTGRRPDIARYAFSITSEWLIKAARCSPLGPVLPAIQFFAVFSLTCVHLMRTLTAW